LSDRNSLARPGSAARSSAFGSFGSRGARSVWRACPTLSTSWFRPYWRGQLPPFSCWRGCGAGGPSLNSLEGGRARHAPAGVPLFSSVFMIRYSLLPDLYDALAPSREAVSGHFLFQSSFCSETFFFHRETTLNASLRVIPSRSVVRIRSAIRSF